ncbi:MULTISPECIES: nitronate monooxygenase [unclassified Beijerinckia]|uniref:NAD(P)H-dependent flavin oxidoreductase n=1 Tax=unclassified Beijerinckia TaxID=2638183 RepID=UPI00089BA312|nr:MULTISPECIES: nitronate monooxygenase [unclassified Beijerinckia]MDH7796300.1 nitronate monooxygenase [Beijerinckia sp. GAS462]SEC39038.1 nitronate monooxygenase [Beijerinckia sp. 28-YEA-48]
MSKSFPFQLRLPVFAAPMFLVSGVDLVVAACRAGVIGSFPSSNCRTVEQLDQWIVSIKEQLGAANGARPVAPWALNLITHSTNARLKDELELVARHKPPIVITALGSPLPVMDVVKSYGGIVIGDVVDIRLARKAVQAGVDGLACICAGAGGHTGHLSPFSFVSAVREFFDGFVVVGGGITDGAGLAGAIAAGADFAYLGTRFLAARESMAVDAYKQMVVDCGPDDLVITSAVSGTPASWLKPSLLACGIDPSAPAGAPPRSYTTGESSLKRWRDTWAAGQGIAKVRGIEPVEEIVDRLDTEYAAAVDRFRAHTYEPA